MILAHTHPSPGVPLPAGPPAVLATLSAAACYLLAARRLRRRGDAWPRRRDLSFMAGGVAVAWAGVGAAPGGPFTGHMVQHVVLGMAAPLLLVTARPLTLALRALPPGGVRRSLLALTRLRVAGWLTFPPVAALLDVGGLWVLYRTGLFAATAHRPLWHLLVHVHVLAAGVLFTFAVCGLDPVRRRWGVAVRGGTLLVAGALHGVLAKTLYAAAPPGLDVATGDLRTGAQVMYYGGDAVALATAVVVGAGWYAARGRALRAASRRPDGALDPRNVPHCAHNIG
ncbi:cytochrome c oxidase assembly protein [Streptomyces sp. NPDC052302]|uniref:cytochrome c oxidase assembly protein n=1 Tax=unclassified Streptomyces TaxID=2593676 RepID=UPI0037D55A82